MVDALLNAERIIDHRVQLPDCATVRSQHFSAFRENVEIGASRHCGDTEPAGNVFDGDFAFLFDYLPDLLPSLFR
jgi:hypothetical protein